jgi:cytochrome c553
VVLAGIYVYVQVAAYDASIDKVYAVAPLALARSTSPDAIARGKHLTESLGGCAMADCHGSDFGGGHVTNAGPIGTMVSPNIAMILPAYSDGELARIIRHGIKKDGRTVRFMASNEFNWLSDADVVAIVSYLRTLPAVDRTTGSTQIGVLGKVLDRRGLIPIDVARRIDHEHIEVGPLPSATAEYGRFIARLCSGCHGDNFSGGPIPGTPSSFPVPLNLTPHDTGLKGWTFDDFERVTSTATRKDGRKLDAFMPVEAIHHMDDVEKHALWAYLQSLPPVAFGTR